MRWLDGITDLMDVSLRELREMVLEQTLESPSYSKEIKPVNLKGNQF